MDILCSERKFSGTELCEKTKLVWEPNTFKLLEGLLLMLNEEDVWYRYSAFCLTKVRLRKAVRYRTTTDLYIYLCSLLQVE